MTLPFSPRSFGLLLAVAAIAGWFDAFAPLTESRQDAPSRGDAVARQAGRRVRAAQSPDTRIPSTERLRERMAEPPLPVGDRNPFVFGPRHVSRPAERDVEPAAMPRLAEPAAPALPVFRLSGIATDTKDGATVLTAILIDNGAMVLARAGDRLSNGYSVVRVESMSVTLVDATGITQTIRLP